MFAFVAEDLERQLSDPMRRFLSDKSRNRYDAASNTLQISKIFNWYATDFAYQGDTRSGLLRLFRTGRHRRSLLTVQFQSHIKAVLNAVPPALDTGFNRSVNMGGKEFLQLPRNGFTFFPAEHPRISEVQPG